MRRISVLIVLVLSGSVLAAQPAGTPAAIAALKSQIKNPVDWSAANARSADVTCDGKPDVILFGMAAKTAWVAVVPGGGKPLAMELPVSNGNPDGFCRAPKNIAVKPLTCESSSMGHLSDCQPVKNCKEFAVEDGVCGAFHFYWDVRTKRMRSWRAAK